MEKLSISGGKLLAGIIFMSAIFFGGGCSDDPDTGTPGSNTVSMPGNAFSPSSLSVSTGTTVIWTNTDVVDHNVTSDTGLFSSGTLSPGATFSFTFSATGTYRYSCTLHPGMVGSVVVSDPAPGY